jgi:hypothetical protein
VITLFKNENKFDTHINDLLEKYNDDHKTNITQAQVKGLVAIETGFNTNEKEIAKIVDRIFHLYQKFNYKGLRKVYANFCDKWKFEKQNGKSLDQSYIDRIFAYNDFYFARDIKNDEGRTGIIKKRIEILEQKEWDKNCISIIILAGCLLLVIAIVLICSKGGEIVWV